MLVTLMRSKLHRLTVTQANLNYIGSITLDPDLLDAAGLYEGEKVQIVNINNGERFETYTIVAAARHLPVLRRLHSCRLCSRKMRRVASKEAELCARCAATRGAGTSNSAAHASQNAPRSAHAVSRLPSSQK